MNIILISGAEWVSAAGFGKIVTTPIITSTKPYLASTEVVFDTNMTLHHYPTTTTPPSNSDQH